MKLKKFLNDDLPAMIGSAVAYTILGWLLIYTFNLWGELMWRQGWLDLGWLKGALTCPA